MTKQIIGVILDISLISYGNEQITDKQVLQTLAGSQISSFSHPVILIDNANACWTDVLHFHLLFDMQVPMIFNASKSFFFFFRVPCYEKRNETEICMYV